MRRGPSALNLLVGVDKPAGITSMDVVSRVRRSVGERRVGHAGTLDPAATGVMVVGIGQATRLMGLLTADRKSYLATIEFGYETTTEDGEGEVTRRAAVPPELASEAFARQAVAGLVGRGEQVPPAYSAISVDGKRAYARARAGEDVELPARPIEVFEAQLLSVEVAPVASTADASDALGEMGAPGSRGGSVGTSRGADGSDGVDARGVLGGSDGQVVLWQCAFTVSKGTYVRSMARDLGRSLGTAAHLARLRRTVSGLVTLGDCLTLEELGRLGAAGVGERALDPLRVLGLPVRELSQRERDDVAHGRRIPVGHLCQTEGGRGSLVLRRLGEEPCDGQQVALFGDGRLWGVWQAHDGSLRSSVNFPAGITGVEVFTRV